MDGDARADVERALGLAAQRHGRPSMPAAQWAHALSLGFGWMPPPDARVYVERARAAGLLLPDGDALALAAPPRLDAPLGFRPDPQAQPGAVDGFAAWLGRVASRSGHSREHVLGQVAALQERMGGWLTADVAILWLARDVGHDVRDAAGEALQSLRPVAPQGTPSRVTPPTSAR